MFEQALGGKQNYVIEDIDIFQDSESDKQTIILSQTENNNDEFPLNQNDNISEETAQIRNASTRENEILSENNCLDIADRLNSRE